MEFNGKTLTAFGEFGDAGEPHVNNKNNPHNVTCEQIGAVDIDALASLQSDLESQIEDVRGLAESADYHTADKNNPHGVTCEQIGAATKEDVEGTKAIIVTVQDNVTSHTSQQIFEAVTSGRAVYLKMWSGTYIGLSWCTADEVLFEASQVYTLAGADGATYSGQNFRLYIIRGNKVYPNSVKVPNQDYIDAQIAHFLNLTQEG